MTAVLFIRITQGIPPFRSRHAGTWILPVFGVWFFLATNDRHIRAVMALLTLEEVSKIIFWLSWAAAVQLTNAAIFRIANMVLFLGACIYVVWWFYSKVRRQ